MKITEFTIKLEPSTGEDRSAVTLTRGDDKVWEACEDNQFRGMYPYEIALINKIQETLIRDFNGNDKKNKD